MTFSMLVLFSNIGQPCYETLRAGEITLINMTEEPADIMNCQSSKLSNINVPNDTWVIVHKSLQSPIFYVLVAYSLFKRCLKMIDRWRCLQAKAEM